MFRGIRRLGAFQLVLREAVGGFEQSFSAKLLVQGRDAERVLNRIATTDLAVPIDKVVYTQFLNLTVTRLAVDRFPIVTAAFTCTQVHAWIHDNTPGSACYCVTTDVSDAYATLNVPGPLTRHLPQFILDDPAPMLVPDEPVLRDGVRARYTTSAGYGHSLGTRTASPTNS